jgi:BirA family transcriptional regulator, biotin operon repressor / biotin---[acetyl-CoA-carboxylase] ligase
MGGATMRLPAALQDAGDGLVVFDTIDSTMEEARRQFDVRQFSADRHRRLWIVAHQQQSGRGRQGRIWSSPTGNLSMTLLLPAPCALKDQPRLGFAAGVALANAARQCLGKGADIALKWPNDLLLSRAKVSGLLLEGLGNGAAVAIGIGVNVASHPEDTPYPAAHLAMEAPLLTPETVFETLAMALVEQLAVFGDGSGFPSIRARWLALSAHLGQTIRVRSPQGELVGQFKDIDQDGRLLLQTSDGLSRIDAGDVFPLDK